jgi:MFS family permease
MTASTAIVQIKADPTMRGRVLALQSILFLGSTPIGGPIVGAIAEHWGARWSIVVGGVATVLAGGWGVLAARRQTPTPLGHVASVDARAEALADLDHDLEVATGEQVAVSSLAPRLS